MISGERAEHGEAYQGHGLLFCWPDGGQIYPDTITRQFNRLVDRAGLPTIRLHDVRHTYATMALRAGVNPKTVSARLGHAEVAFTLQTYTDAVPELDRDEAERVASLFLTPISTFPSCDRADLVTHRVARGVSQYQRSSPRQERPIRPASVSKSLSRAGFRIRDERVVVIQNPRDLGPAAGRGDRI